MHAKCNKYNNKYNFNYKIYNVIIISYILTKVNES